MQSCYETFNKRLKWSNNVDIIFDDIIAIRFDSIFSFQKGRRIFFNEIVTSKESFHKSYFTVHCKAEYLLDTSKIAF